jgi:hypothetical protein
MVVAPDDVRADHAGLLSVAGCRPSSSSISRTRSRSVTEPVSAIRARRESPGRANLTRYGTLAPVIADLTYPQPFTYRPSLKDERFQGKSPAGQPAGRLRDRAFLLYDGRSAGRCPEERERPSPLPEARPAPRAALSSRMPQVNPADMGGHVKPYQREPGYRRFQP